MLRSSRISFHIFFLFYDSILKMRKFSKENQGILSSFFSVLFYLKNMLYVKVEDGGKATTNFSRILRFQLLNKPLKNVLFFISTLKCFFMFVFCYIFTEQFNLKRRNPSHRDFHFLLFALRHFPSHLAILLQLLFALIQMEIALGAISSLLVTNITK